MRKSVWPLSMLLTTALLIAGQAQQQQQQNPYAGQAQRPIKALSADEIRAYLTGQGMGLAKAAELNSYPGPKHVLELAEQLKLTGEQTSRVLRTQADMRDEAIRLGRLIVEKEGELDAAFARGAADERMLAATVAEIARLQGELRLAHLRAHLSMRRLLSQAQVKKYDELRGYGAKPKGHDPSHHTHHE